MTTLQVVALTMGAGMLILLYVSIRAIMTARHFMKLYVLERESCDAWRKLAEECKPVADNYVDAAKLISIRRDGRENVWTFARGDQFYTIETYGQLSDDIPLWRKQLGVED